MLISTRGRYALRVVVDLADFFEKKKVKDFKISSRQEISLKYLEGIMTELSKAGIVEGLHGKGGGYKMAVPPEKCTVKSILEITEGTISPVACLAKKENDCPRKDKCFTLPLWEDLNTLISDFFEKKTVKDLIK